MNRARLPVVAAGAALAAAVLCVLAARRARVHEPASPAPAARALAPADARRQADDHFTRARAAYERRDFVAFLDESRAAARLVPTSVRARYNVACGAALTGRHDEALAALAVLVDWGVDPGAARDPDLKALGGDPRFQALLQRLEALHQPLGASRVAFTLREKGLITEGLAYDPRARAFFVSSVHARKIVHVGPDGAARDFVPSARDGLLAVLALRADPVRRALWACSSGVREMRGFTAEDEGRAALYEFDLDSGALRQRLDAPAGGEPTARNFNDLTLDAGGALYVSDATSGELLRLPRGGGALEVLVPRGTLRAPQGLAALPDGALYVADYALGLARVDTRSGSVAFVSAPADVLLTGIDGLVAGAEGLVAIQNGLTPARVVLLELAPGGLHVKAARVLERAHALFDEPTLGVVVEGELFYVAASQWGKVDAQGRPGPPEALREPVVLRLPLAGAGGR